jgi:hypothetical protein
MTLGRRQDNLTVSELEALRGATQAGNAIEDRLIISDQSGAPMQSRITLFRETAFGAGPPHAIGTALAEKYAPGSLRTAT